jgi:hypothetical protein
VVCKRGCNSRSGVRESGCVVVVVVVGGRGAESEEESNAIAEGNVD